MNAPTPVKKGLTLAWSIGLGVVFLGLTSAVLLPSTKSARAAISAQYPWQGVFYGIGSIFGIVGADHASPAPTPTPSPTPSSTPTPTATPAP